METGSIRGLVQHEDKALPEQRLMLIRFGPDQEVQRTPGQTDAQGRFLFENLAIGSHYTYFIGVRYNEQLHRSAPVTLLDAQQVAVSLDIDGTTQQEAPESNPQAALSLANHLFVVVRRETHLEVREIVRLVNTGATPYRGPGASASPTQPVFQLPLPQEAYNLSQVQGLAPEHIRTQASSIAYMAPLAPGEHRILFSYSLPWRGALTTVLLERTLATSILDVLVEDVHLLATSDLSHAGQVTIDPHTFAHFRGVNLGPQTRSWVQLIPPSTPSTLWISRSAYGLIVGLALLGILAPLRLWYGNRATGPGPLVDHRDAAPKARDIAKRLVHDLALLESQRESGQVTEEEYQQRRKEGKDHLRHLVEHLYMP